MKKTLLLFAAVLCSLMASAGDGIVTVGANITVLPSSKYDGNVEWKAWTWVYNSGTEFGDPMSADNPNYNVILGEGGPSADNAGLQWYEPGYNMADIEDINYDKENDEGEFETIVWEEHYAPFSSDANWNGRPSYQWTTSNIMADIFVRRTFTLDASQLLSGPVYLACGHDDAPCEYYINGELVWQATDGWNENEFYLLTDEQKALIKLNGEENLIAFHVHQNWGGALADCGLYTKVEGGLDMGYAVPWEGKVLFNSIGGYNWDGASPSNNPYHPWSALYEAQEGDEYSFTMPASSDDESPWMEKLQFKSPIKIQEGHAYSFTAKLTADQDFTNVLIRLGDNDDDAIELGLDEMSITAGEETEVFVDFDGEDVNNFSFSFDFGGGEDGAYVTISEISLYDVTTDEELWVGTHYFNYIDMNKAVTKFYIWDDTLNDGDGDFREAVTEEEIAEAEMSEVAYEPAFAPEIEGRHETMAWTLPDFDDTMWDAMMMPVGNQGYMDEVQSIWPGGDNTNFWIRRNFNLDKVNERLSYELNVCHDDCYETYVNGHLLQKNVGWTNGKSPVEVHIPAKYLNAGKNVIATYIQQNWGGKFYDCGINVYEVNYEECAKMLRDAIAYAQTDTMLTNAMKAEVQALIAEGRNELATNKDAAEIRNYAKEFKNSVNEIFGASGTVKTLKETTDICRMTADNGYLGAALEAAIAALDTCSTKASVNTNLENLRNARKANAMERHNENYVGSVPEIVEMRDAGFCDPLTSYYIYNVGAKLFLGGGEAWGTHAALEYISYPMMLVQSEGQEGELLIETFRANGDIGAMDFLNWGGFVDTNINGDNNTWELIPVEGKENVYNIAQYGSTNSVTGGKNYLGLRSGDNAFAPSYYIVDTDMRTPELETNQWMFVTREEMLGLIATADEYNPVDLSFLITNPGFDQRLSIAEWSNEKEGENSGFGVWGRGGNHPNFVFEAYNTTSFSMYQDIRPDELDEALPAGTYVLSLQGYYRDGLEQAHVNKVLNEEPLAQRAIFYAGPVPFNEGATVIEDCETMYIMPVHIEANKVPGIGWLSNPGNMRMPGESSGCEQAAEHYFKCGLYKNYLVFNISEENAGAYRIGVQKEADQIINNAVDVNGNHNYGDWCVMDNWRLKYYGNEVEDPTAINGVETDEIKKAVKADKTVYNLLGQKLTKAQKGVNIIGGKKVIRK